MKRYRLKVWGDFACFTRPEMKVERVSYEIMTPSAARAIFEAVLWKPAIRWVVTKIAILKPVQWVNIRRNEVKGKASERKSSLYIEDERVQRSGLFLKDVAYEIEGYFNVLDETPSNSSRKFEEMFERRSTKGQCVMQPYLGCREFSAFFELMDISDEAVPIADNRDLGWMFYDFDYKNCHKGEYVPKFFFGALRGGIMNVPHPDSAEVKG